MKLFKGFKSIISKVAKFITPKIFKRKKAETKATEQEIAKEIIKTEEKTDEVANEADIVIQNFKDLVNSMVEDDYTLRGHHSFKPTNRRTVSGRDAKQWSAEKIVGYGQEIGGVLKEAIDNVGKEQVAKNIQDYGITIVELAEQIVFAIYEKRYAKWGGSIAAYFYSLQMELRSILETKQEI